MMAAFSVERKNEYVKNIRKILLRTAVTAGAVIMTALPSFAGEEKKESFVLRGWPVEDRIALILYDMSLDETSDDEGLISDPDVKPAETCREPEEMSFVGDSRVVGMESSCSGNVYIGEVAAGYGYLVSVVPTVCSIADARPQDDIVVTFGVNDVGNINAYIAEYAYLYEKYRGRFWVMSVNPIEDGAAAANGYFARNYMVENFNALLRDAFPDIYLDCYDMMLQNGYQTWDGVHYSPSTYQDIQEYAYEMISEKNRA